MNDFRNTIGNIQRAVGVKVDKVFGPVTAEAVMRALNSQAGIQPQPEEEHEAMYAGLDDRTISNIKTLDPKARERFANFSRAAKAVAAPMGFEYVMISGNRTFEEQDAIYKQAKDGVDNDGDGRIDEADERVTKARGGDSNHNYRIAGDYGVFWGKIYVDNHTPAKAAAVHRAVAEIAHNHGIEAGAYWKSFPDLPHFEIETGLTIAQKRKLFKEKGSVL